MFGKMQYHSKTNEPICDYVETNRENVFKALKKINDNYTVEYNSPYGSLMLCAY
jgi:hypothetical protein